LSGREIWKINWSFDDGIYDGILCLDKNNKGIMRLEVKCNKPGEQYSYHVIQRIVASPVPGHAARKMEGKNAVITGNAPGGYSEDTLIFYDNGETHMCDVQGCFSDKVSRELVPPEKHEEILKKYDLPFVKEE